MADPVRDACEACYDADKDDCSKFARDVAARVGVTLSGLADQIVDVLRSNAGGWSALADGQAAATAASAGKLVIAGLKGGEQATPNPHGHVVVVVSGPLARNAYPTAYWGSLGDQPYKDTTLNFAWVEADRDRISYAAHDIA